MKRIIVPVFEGHVKGSSRTVTGNPIAKAIKACGFCRVRFDGSDTFQTNDKAKGGTWTLRLSPANARKWLKEWYHGRAKVPFRFVLTVDDNAPTP